MSSLVCEIEGRRYASGYMTRQGCTVASGSSIRSRLTWRFHVKLLIVGDLTYQKYSLETRRHSERSLTEAVCTVPSTAQNRKVCQLPSRYQTYIYSSRADADITSHQAILESFTIRPKLRWIHMRSLSLHTAQYIYLIFHPVSNAQKGARLPCGLSGGRHRRRSRHVDTGSDGTVSSHPCSSDTGGTDGPGVLSVLSDRRQ